ncbi:uncharacterized protein LOC121737766 [Aricia agestis]|uniref:uncharacterized protein LOC121737766 n=1 Tax=Aricia agestis TaxID=91739 RepID=UPI001C205E2D|nr:uncharacterized protein LOC121737766 [Aricia agestis]
MCDILPEISKFCMCLSLRLGMLIIAVLAIVTGAIGLSVMQQRSNVNLDLVKNATDVTAQNVIKKGSTLLTSVISFMMVLFMIAGISLLIGNLWDNDGAIQGFVGIMLLNLLLGFICVVTTALQCITQDQCLLSDFDWLSGAVILIAITGILFLWVYFTSIASSYLAGA